MTPHGVSEFESPALRQFPAQLADGRSSVRRARTGLLCLFRACSRSEGDHLALGRLVGGMEGREPGGDVLAFAHESRLRAEDSCGEVLRGVALGGDEARGSRRGSRRVCALRTELGRRGELTTAVTTRPRQGRRTPSRTSLRTRSCAGNANTSFGRDPPPPSVFV